VESGGKSYTQNLSIEVNSKIKPQIEMLIPSTIDIATDSDK
jgi:hypothetical protein